MLPLSLVLLSLLICCTIFSHAEVLHRAPRHISAPTQYANSTTVVPVSSTTSNMSTLCTTNTSTLCTRTCTADPIRTAEYVWPHIDIQTIGVVVATVVYKVDPNNVTSTSTRYNNATFDSNIYTTIDAAVYEDVCNISSVTLENGTPHFNLVTTVYTAPDKPYTVSSMLTYPTAYTNMGWLYDVWCPEERTTLSLAVTPTATPPGYTNPYDAPIDEAELSNLLSSRLKGSCVVFPPSGIASNASGGSNSDGVGSGSNAAGPGQVIVPVPRLTDTTEFEDTPFTANLTMKETKSAPPAPASTVSQVASSQRPLSSNPPPSQPPLSETSLTSERAQPSQGLISTTAPSPAFPQSQASASSQAPVLSQLQSQSSISALSPPDAIITTKIVDLDSSAVAASRGSIVISPVSISAAESSGVSSDDSLIVANSGGTQRLGPPSSTIDRPATSTVISIQTASSSAPVVTVSGTLVSPVSVPTAVPSSVSNDDSLIIADSGGTQRLGPPSSTIDRPATLIVISTQTASSSAPAVTVPDKFINPVSIPTAIDINTNTVPVSQVAASRTAVTLGPIIVVSNTFTPGDPAVITSSDGQIIPSLTSSIALVVGTQTILPGASAITVSGTTPISLPLIPTAIMMGTETFPISVLGPFVEVSQTLSAGGSAVATFSIGQTISLTPSIASGITTRATILPEALGDTISGTEDSLTPSRTTTVADGETPSETTTAASSGEPTATRFTGVASRSLPIIATDWQPVMMAFFTLGGLFLAS